ncbi:MAG: hypothetical protein IT162_19540 [Bryobacterales bacterium]|nr:hypothetical protein [Bryobacterales bacterium]
MAGPCALGFPAAKLFTTPPLPFAIVECTVNGEEQSLGLRLDLDKQVFLDHFSDAAQEQEAQAAAPQIVAFLADEYEASQPLKTWSTSA